MGAHCLKSVWRMAATLLLLLVPALVSSSNLGEKSTKKGLVIPSWPRHFCYDWNAFTTVSWWYHYHTYEDPVDISPWWCTYPSGARPSGEARQECFPSDPEISFIPMVYGIPGYGHWVNTTDPDIGPEHDVILGWNEPNQASGEHPSGCCSACLDRTPGEICRQDPGGACHG